MRLRPAADRPPCASPLSVLPAWLAGLLLLVGSLAALLAASATAPDARLPGLQPAAALAAMHGLPSHPGERPLHAIATAGSDGEAGRTLRLPPPLPPGSWPAHHQRRAVAAALPLTVVTRPAAKAQRSPPAQAPPGNFRC